MIAVDLRNGVLLENADIDETLEARAPYKQWLREGMRYLDSELIDRHIAAAPMDQETLTLYQKMFNLSREERTTVVACWRRRSRKPSARWATTRRWPCCRRRCVRLSTISASSSRRSPIRRSIRCANASSCRWNEYRPRSATCSNRTGARQSVVMNSPVLSQRKLRADARAGHVCGSATHSST